MGSQVAFEAGAETQALVVADFLPEAMRRVESAHQHRFKRNPVVLVFATSHRFERVTGYNADRVAGVSTPGNLYLAPQDKERLKPILLHELSHVLLRQWIGSYRFLRTPVWFREGLATWAARGGGAGAVSRTQAVRALKSGASFEPDLTAPFLFKRDAPHWGLSHHMFYRQSSLFIEYLAETGEAWRRLLQGIHNGSPFERAFSSSYADGIDSLWAVFLDHVE